LSTSVYFAIVGGGFYGARLALALAALRLGRVLLIEQERGLMRRASFVNQARLHNGYHYPRAPRTGVTSRRNFRRFLEEYQFAIRADVPMVYAIARDSLVSAEQFVRFCSEIGAPCRPAGPEEARLFDPVTVEAAFATEEFSLDAVRIAAKLGSDLAAAGVECRFGHKARVVAASAKEVTLNAGSDRIHARYVLNCTYASLDGIGLSIGNAVKKEVAEIAMIRPPPELARLAVTVMDGPFFSTMPFPALSCHSLTHVRYTPHHSYIGPGQPPAAASSRVGLMIRDAARFLPSMEAAVPLRSLYEVKAVLERAEQNDARPVLVASSPESSRLISVLGSKFDHIYDAEALLTAHVWD
jgi:glycine/D-amino acid oxidase-like deaminating enzyme